MLNILSPGGTKAKAILAEFIEDLSKNMIFYSLNSLVKHLKDDRYVIIEYLKGNKSGYYESPGGIRKWKFTYTSD